MCTSWGEMDGDGNRTLKGTIIRRFRVTSVMEERKV